MIKYKIDETIEVTQNDLDKYIGKTFKSNNYGEFRVLGIGGARISHKKYICEFIKTNYQVLMEGDTIKKGAIKDPYYPIYSGKGYIGEKLLHVNKIKHPLLSTWQHLIARCYDTSVDEYKYYGGNGVYVHDDWHNFSIFIEDYYNLPGYECDVKLNIDKDILTEDKLYSKETCCLVTHSLNSFFLYKQKTNTSGKTGVSWSKRDRRWRATLYCDGVQKNPCCSKNINDASIAYWNAKFKDFEARFSDINPIIYDGAISKLIRDAKSEGIVLGKEK